MRQLFFLTLSLLLTADIAYAQVRIATNETNTSGRLSQRDGRSRGDVSPDSLGTDKEIPIGLRVWTIDPLFGDRIEIRDTAGGLLQHLLFDELSTVTVLGRNKLNLYGPDGVLQCRGDSPFNALKYMNLYHRYRAVRKGETDDEFLGL